MSTLAPLVPRSISLDDFVALNDEIAALARAGVPLGKGLLELGSDLPGRLGRLATEVGRRLEQGESLEQVVAKSPDLFPPAYRAIVAAGIRVGSLPAALERISQSARQTTQTRVSFILALLYPIAILALAYVLLLFWLSKIVPVMATVFADIDPRTMPIWNAALAVREQMGWWGPLVPLLVAAWWLSFWWRCSRAAAGVELHPLLSLGSIGRLMAMRRAGRLAAFAETLAALVEYGIPLPDAMVLSAETTADRHLVSAAQQAAERLVRGEPIASAAGLPPTLAWALTSGQFQADLPQILRRMAAIYRDESARLADWLQTARPLVLTALVGGSVVSLLALVHWGPFILILHRLAEAQTR